MNYEFKIYEHDHFYKQYEDHKNNLYMLILNDDVEKWIKENINGYYDINCDNYYISGFCDYMFIEFKEHEDAMAFKLKWL